MEGGPNKSGLFQNWLPQEIRFPFYNLKKFWKSEKTTAKSCRMHWNLINNIEFEPFNSLKVKYGRWGPNNIVIMAGTPSPLPPPHTHIQQGRTWKNAKKWKRGDPENFESSYSAGEGGERGGGAGGCWDHFWWGLYPLCMPWSFCRIGPPHPPQDIRSPF